MASNLCEPIDERVCVLCDLPEAEHSCESEKCQLYWHGLCSPLDVPCPLQHVPKQTKGQNSNKQPNSKWDEALKECVKQGSCRSDCAKLKSFLEAQDGNRCDIHACNECGVLKCKQCPGYNFLDNNTLGVIRHTHFRPKDGSVLCKVGNQKGTKTSSDLKTRTSTRSTNSCTSSGPGLTVRLFSSFFNVLYLF